VVNEANPSNISDSGGVFNLGGMTVKTPKMHWWLLYALLPLAGVLLVWADLEAPTAAWRELAELAVSLWVLGAMALWVRANRIELVHRDGVQHAEVARRFGASGTPRPVPRWRPACPGTASHHPARP
jgi:hypothetical protein